MRAISLFSGVGGFDLGFERAGIETVLQVEQDRHCLAVLERHWPDVERITDVRDLREGWSPRVRERAMGAGRAEPDAEHPRQHGSGEGNGTDGRDVGDSGCERTGQTAERIRSDRRADVHSGRGKSSRGVDLIYGGFPCQDVSVAGARAGLAGERSGLWFEFHRIVRELRPRWVVIENVPGLLSSNGGADFAVILSGLDELGFDAAWAVLDSQHFGVPQRRRRVFIVGGPRGRGAEQILSLCESCGGNPETGGAAGEDIAYALAASVRGTGDGHGNAWNSTYVANTLKVNQGHAHGADLETYVPTLGTNHGVDNLAHAGHHGHSSPRGDGSDNLVAETVRSHPRPSSNSIGQLAPGGVRRLTPRECERLQGFPDDWTSGQADSHRYRQMGNAVTVPVAEWIGHRLMAVDSL